MHHLRELNAHQLIEDSPDHGEGLTATPEASPEDHHSRLGSGSLNMAASSQQRVTVFFFRELASSEQLRIFEHYRNVFQEKWCVLWSLCCTLDFDFNLLGVTFLQRMGSGGGERLGNTSACGKLCVSVVCLCLFQYCTDLDNASLEG